MSLFDNWQNKKYTTRNGKPVRILCIDGPFEEYPVVGILDYDVFFFSKAGAFYDTSDCSRYSSTDQLDIIEVKEKKKGWINIYPKRTVGLIHSTKENADKVFESSNREACIEIEWTDGEGL